MLTLHGFSFSNYYNIVKHTLLYKGIPFEEHKVYPREAELLAVNPAGKVPALTTERGTHLSESSVLVDYLEDAYPEPALYPADPDRRGQVRQLMKIAELYLELPARRLLPAVLGGAQLPDSLLQEVRATLERGVAALTRLADFDPYLLGAEQTLADIYLHYALVIPRMACPSQLDWDLIAAVPGLAEWSAMMADSDIARQVEADHKANAPEFMAYLAKSR